MENLDREEILEVIPDSEAAREPVIERPYTLRRLKDGDLFPLLKILKKIGIRDCKEAFIQVASGEKSVNVLSK